MMEFFDGEISGIEENKAIVRLKTRIPREIQAYIKNNMKMKTDKTIHEISMNFGEIFTKKEIEEFKEEENAR